MLPKIDLPTYELKLPSSGKEILVRPFLVKEEKLVLMAAESDDNTEIIRTVIQIVNNCILTEGVDISKLPFFDVDYLFIALRAKSVGESVDIRFTCNNPVDGVPCKSTFPAKIDIANVDIKKIEMENIIPIGGNISVKMKYPSYSDMKSLDVDNMDEITRNVSIISHCIDQIISGDEITTRKDVTPQELFEFVEGLTKEQYSKLEYWASNFPSFFIKSQAKCGKCGFEHNLEYTDFQSFFV